MTTATSKMQGSTGRKLPPNAGKGRKKGSKNKVTRDTREALALLIENNHDKMQTWLDDVAAADPGKALTLLLQMIEFTTPKMARTELTGRDGGPMIIEPTLNIILRQ